MTDAQPLQLSWAQHEGRDCIEITGWTDALRAASVQPGERNVVERLAIYPSDALVPHRTRPPVPPVAGRFTVHGRSILFVPRFPFVSGIGYSLLIEDADGESSEVGSIRRDPPDSIPTAEVVEIYPTAHVVPVNLLRVYVRFSHPMSEGWAARAIDAVIDDTGERLQAVFLPPEPELWDSARRRLTMLLDPGRIKRGLVPNLESGYPLVEGATIRITVDAEFRDATGQPLKSEAHRTYHVGPALRSRVDPTRWRISVPDAKTPVPLLVEFDRPLDHGLLLNSLSVQGPIGDILDGVVSIENSECAWSFTPAHPWQAGEHHLVIESRLEDIAGNTPVRVFDRDITNPQDAPLSDAGLKIPFTCVARDSTTAGS